MFRAAPILVLSALAAAHSPASATDSPLEQQQREEERERYDEKKRERQARPWGGSGGHKVAGRGKPMHKPCKRKRVGRGGRRQNYRTSRK